MKLQEEVLSEMGFQPVEIVDLLYQNLGKTDRRAKAQSISRTRSVISEHVGHTGTNPDPCIGKRKR